MNELFTLEDSNNTLFGFGSSSVYHALDTSNIGTEEFADVKIDFAIVNHSISSNTHTFTFQIFNVGWSGGYYILDKNGGYVNSDANVSYNSATNTITYTTSDDHVTLVLYCTSFRGTFSFTRLTKKAIDLTDSIIALNDSKVKTIKYLNLADNTEGTATYTQSEGVNQYLGFVWLCFYKKTDFQFNCTQNLIVGKVNKVYLGTLSDYLPNGGLSGNAVLKMTVKSKSNSYDVSYDSVKNDYYFNVDLTGVASLNRIRFSLYVHESTYISESVTEFVLDTGYQEVSNFTQLLNAIESDNISMVQLENDITFVSDVTVSKDIYIYGNSNTLLLNGHGLVISENVTFKSDNIAFAKGDTAILQKENSIVELDNAIFAFNSSTKYNNLGSCIFCEVDFDNLDIITDFKTRLTNVTFYNNHSCLLHGGELAVDNCIFLNNNTDYIDANNVAFLYQVDGNASITNSAFDINYDTEKLCADESNIGFAQALLKIGLTAVVNGQTHKDYVVNNNLNFFIKSYNNHSHVFCKYYYPQIEACVFTSPAVNRDSDSICYCASETNWVYKQNVQISRATWGSENRKNNLGIQENISLIGNERVQEGKSDNLISNFYLTYNDKTIPIPAVSVKYYDLHEVDNILLSSTKPYVRNGDAISLYATVKDAEGDVAKGIAVTFFTETEEEET